MADKIQGPKIIRKTPSVPKTPTWKRASKVNRKPSK